MRLNADGPLRREAGACQQLTRDIDDLTHVRVTGVATRVDAEAQRVPILMT